MRRRTFPDSSPQCLPQFQQCNNVYDCDSDFSDEEECFAFVPVSDPIKPDAAASPFTQGLMHWKVDGRYKLLSLEFRGDDGGPITENAYHTMATEACKQLLPGFRGSPYVQVQTYK